MATATVTSKGQITIPAEVRKALRLEPGTQVQFFAGENGEWIFRPRTGSIWDLRGCVPSLGRAVSIEEMNEAVEAAVAEDYMRSVGGRVGNVQSSQDDEAA